MSKTYQIIIIGAGPGGLCMAAKLREAGYEDFLILERADGVGGTWRYNTYPGAACDIASHLYSFSFFPNPEWSRPFARQPEILAYFERFAMEYALDPYIRLGVNVVGASWDGDSAKWNVETEQGIFTAGILISAVGMFNDIKIPDIAGLGSFSGEVIHSARWGAGRDLSEKSVAVIGSGATGIQIVPQVAPRTKRFFHFQRQPQWVGPKEDTPFTEEQIERFRSDPEGLRQLRSMILGRVDGAITYADPAMIKAMEAAGLQSLALVENPVTRAKLMPVGPWGCHRPLNSTNYYPTFNLPHVEVVTDAIEAITREAIVTVDGAERKVDTIILATGFETTKFLTVIKVVGRDGIRLNDAWSEGPQAYLGVSTVGFPNLFMIYGPNTNNGTVLHVIEAQVVHILRLLDQIKSEKLRMLEVREDIMTAYNARLQEDIQNVEVWHAGCNGYYRMPSGRVVTQWPHNMADFTAAVNNAPADAYVGN